MRTIYGIISSVVIIILILNSFNFQDFINNLKESSNFDLYKSLGVIFSAFISLVNLGIVLIFFISERIFKVKLKDFERKAFWYRKIVIEKNIDALNKVFDNMTDMSIYNTNIEESIFVNRIKSCKNGCIKVINEISDTIRIIDNVLFEKIEKMKLDFEDGFMRKSESLFFNNGKPSDIVEYTKQQKLLIINILYKYEMFDYNHSIGFWKTIRNWLSNN